MNITHSESERAAFLAAVTNYVKRDPESAGYIGMAVASGLRSVVSDEREKSADMEIIASVLLERKFKGRDQLIRSKLEKWDGKCSLRWDWYLDPPEDGE